MDLKAMAAVMGLEANEFLEIVALFMSTAVADMDQMQSALDTGNAVLGSEAAHSLKGAAGNLGFSDIARMAAAAEQTCMNGNLAVLAETLPLMRIALDRVREAI